MRGYAKVRIKLLVMTGVYGEGIALGEEAQLHCKVFTDALRRLNRATGHFVVCVPGWLATWGLWTGKEGGHGFKHLRCCPPWIACVRIGSSFRLPEQVAGKESAFRSARQSGPKSDPGNAMASMAVACLASRRTSGLFSI